MATTNQPPPTRRVDPIRENPGRGRGRTQRDIARQERLNQQTPTPAPGTPTPPPARAAYRGSTGAAEQELRRILSRFGLAELADIAYEFYLAGITDIDQILLELEDTEAFRARFPGIRDAQTGESIASVAEYVAYERGLSQQLASYGIAPLSRAEVGAIIGSRRSLAEVKDDLDAYYELQTNAGLRSQFFAYTGVDPGAEGLLALSLGLAPDLERTYQQAVEAGVSTDEFFGRLTGSIDADHSIRERQDRVVTLDRELARTDLSAETRQGYLTEKARMQTELSNLTQYGNVSAPTIQTLDTALTGAGAFSAPAASVNRFERLRALRRAALHTRGQFQAGGQLAIGQTRFERPRVEETF